MTSNALLNHLKELKIRFLLWFLNYVILFLTCYVFSEELIFVIAKPLINANEGKALIFTTLHEAFLTHIKIAFLVATICQVPLLLLNIYLFMKAGLYKNEVHILRNIGVRLISAFLIGVMLTYTVILPLTWSFFISYQNDYISLEARIGDYVALASTTLLIIPVMAMFQIMLFETAKKNIIPMNVMVRVRKYWYILSLLIATIISPPDVYTQIIYTIPLVLIYELTLFKICIQQTRR